MSPEVSIEETRTASALTFLFDHFGLKLLQAFVRETNEAEDLPLNAMVGKIFSVVLYFCILFLFKSTPTLLLDFYDY